jgi:hypothetical protein
MDGLAVAVCAAGALLAMESNLVSSSVGYVLAGSAHCLCCVRLAVDGPALQLDRWEPVYARLCFCGPASIASYS